MDRMETLDADPPEVCDRPEAVARAWNVGRTSIYRLISSGELRSIRIGGSRRIPRSAQAEYLERQRREAS